MHFRRFRTPVALVAAGTAAILILAGSPAFACEKGSQSDIAFWNSVKDSKSPDEIQAYLSTCPDGTFSALARIRLRSLGGSNRVATPTTQTPPPQRQTPNNTPGNDDDVVTDIAKLSEVQNILFNLNYKVLRFDGVVDGPMREAIIDWQKTAKLQPTGQISAANFARLKRARIPTVWGAVAYNSKGASGVIWQQPNRRSAETKALEACNKRSKSGRKCDVLAAADSACGALAFYYNKTGKKTYFGSYAAIRPTLGQAITSSLRSCNSSDKSGNKCGVRITFCANGSHKG